MDHYVIKSWKIQERIAEGDTEHVRIEGRPVGFGSWLLNLIGIVPTMTLIVTRDKITFETGSFKGSVVHHTPLEKTCSTFYGYSVPWVPAVVMGCVAFWAASLLVTAIGGKDHLAAALGLVADLVAGIIVFRAICAYGKKLTLGYTDIGGYRHSINFRPSFIEGQQIDKAAAEKICSLIQRLVDAKGSNSSGKQ